VTWLVPILLAQATAIEKQRSAMEIQREAARKQAESVARAFGLQRPLVAAECDPLPDTDASALIGSAATSQHVDPKLLRAVIAQESGFRPCAESGKGALGLMQLMPATVDQFQVADPFDPQQNIEAGAKYLKQLLDKYGGDLSLALAAYNAGPAAVDAAKGIPDIRETRDYVKAILAATQPAPPQTPMPKPTGN